MTWLLTLFLIAPNGTIVPVRAGLMIDHPTCRLAGITMSRALVETGGKPVAWRCNREAST